jgi:lipopolysaccharide cholinephosphotransferase
MNDLQKCQLNLLKGFIRVCDKHNLTYYLCGGTCLGAVRHQGFIPWDDDIDVMMPRKDYDKFIKLQKEYEGTSYFIQTYKSDPKYPYNYGKLRDSSTTFIEDNFVNHRINHGVWIDIFPLDGLGNKIQEPIKYKNKILRIWINFYLCYFPALFRKIRARTFFKDIGLNLLAFLTWFGNIGHYRNKYVDYLCHKTPFETTKIVGNRFGFNMKKEAMDRDIFGEGVYLQFEDIKARVPTDYDKYLTNLYRDYMKLPPEEKRIGHHFDKGLSLTQGYEEYMKEHKM